MTLLFIFDMDNVLYDYDWRVRMRGMTEITGLSTDEMRERWWLTGREWEAEAGCFLTGDEYLAAFSEAMGVEIDRHDWVRIRGAAMTPWPDSIAAVKRASELGQITLLTNNGVLAGEHLQTLAPALAPLFGEHLLTSSFYGARKPDPTVYENVLTRYGIAAEDAFFADDMVENIDSALSVGITAHHFTTPALMHAAIEDFAVSRGVTAAV
jgi:putative hydrolase of the HAD superfamily